MIKKNQTLSKAEDSMNEIIISNTEYLWGIEQIEERISELEDKNFEITQLENKKKKE